MTDTTLMAIGSLQDAFKEIGRVSAVNIVDLKPFKKSDILTATEDSSLLYELSNGTLALMLRCRLDAISKSVTFELKGAKHENAADGTVYEDFYDEIATITFSTSANAIAAQRGGFYCDEIVITPDDSLKGIGDTNKWAKCTYGDVLGFLNQALVCTVLTGTWAEVDITNS